MEQTEVVADVYSLDAAIIAAKQEADDMAARGIEVVTPHILLLGRKHAPVGLEAVKQVVVQNEWLLGMESVEGRLLLDTVIATVSRLISDAVMLHIRNKAEEQLSKAMAKQHEEAMTKGMRRRKFRIEDKEVVDKS